MGHTAAIIPKGAVVAELVLSPPESWAQEGSKADRAENSQSPNSSYPFSPHLIDLPPRSTLPADEPLPAPLQAMVDMCQGITESEQTAALVREYSDVFSLDGKMGNCDWVLFEINTGDRGPRYTLQEKEAIVAYVIKNIKEYHNEESKTFWSGMSQNEDQTVVSAAAAQLKVKTTNSVLLEENAAIHCLACPLLNAYLVQNV
ncbi:hypothetical protein FOCC_FOCC005338 [Frankliniella occidentalis]|nr:hypothetical protein FOCC_FOCC005338 [Frankliniella occidentalis]